MNAFTLIKKMNAFTSQYCYPLHERKHLILAFLIKEASMGSLPLKTKRRFVWCSLFVQCFLFPETLGWKSDEDTKDEVYQFLNRFMIRFAIYIFVCNCWFISLFLKPDCRSEGDVKDIQQMEHPRPILWLHALSLIFVSCLYIMSDKL